MEGTTCPTIDAPSSEGIGGSMKPVDDHEMDNIKQQIESTSTSTSPVPPSPSSYEVG